MNQPRHKFHILYPTSIIAIFNNNFVRCDSDHYEYFCSHSVSRLNWLKLLMCLDDLLLNIVSLNSVSFSMF